MVYYIPKAPFLCCVPEVCFLNLLKESDNEALLVQIRLKIMNGVILTFVNTKGGIL